MKPLLLTICGALILLIGYQGAFVLSPSFAQENKASNQKTNEFINGVRKATEQGDAQAQFNFGVMYEHGREVPQDYAEAVRWYRKAAEQGDAQAQFNLGGMYLRGQGVPQDYAEAGRWYRKAAEQGFAQAQYNLGIMYAKGQGVPQDYVEAHMWLSLTASRAIGDMQQKSAAARDLVTRKMTAKQIIEAQHLAREWKQKLSQFGGAPMEEPRLYFHWPGIFFAFPAVILIVGLPAVLIYVVFARTSLKLWVKVLLIPICLIAPLLATALWPFLIKVSGFVGATGGDGTLSYTEIAMKLFGDYSDYVWGGITTILVLLIYRWSGRRAKVV